MCLLVCLFVCMSVCLTVYLSVCLSVCQSIAKSGALYINSVIHEAWSSWKFFTFNVDVHLLRLAISPFLVKIAALCAQQHLFYC